MTLCGIIHEQQAAVLILIWQFIWDMSRENIVKKKRLPNILAFANETEVLALWDKILNSVRKRPE